MNYSKRFVIIGICLFLYAGFIWYQTWDTLVSHGDEYRAKVEKLQREARPLPAVRGFIFAEGGELLAGSLPEYDVRLDFRSTTVPDPKGRMNIPKDTIEKYFGPNGAGSQAMAHAFSDPSRNTRTPEQCGREVLTAYRNRDPQHLILRALPYLDYKRLREQPYFDKKTVRNGLLKEERAHRYRPYGESRMASATIGAVYTKNWGEGQIAGHGQRGIEKGFDDMLAGTPGLGYDKKLRGSMTNITIQRPVDGANVHTTIDIELQEILDYELAKRLVELNAAQGWAAFVEVKTGKIRAVSNLCNNNGVCTEDYNHLFSDLSAPGSTFKTVSYMILLENGQITPDTIVDTGNTKEHYATFNYHGKQIRDDHPVGKVSARKAIEQSSNIAVAKLTVGAYEHDPQSYLDAVNRIGFLDDHALSDSEMVLLKTQNMVPMRAFNREFPEAIRARHRRVGDKWWSKMSLGQISYGYETDIPGIYILQFYNAIANNGKLVRPYIVDHVEKDGDVLWKQEPTVINKKICSDATLRHVRDALEDVVKYGTARSEKNSRGLYIREGAKSDKVAIAGKTGTAQRMNEAGGYTGAGHNVSFVGYFPADNPQYCGIVVINTKGYHGGNPGGGYMAGPVFRHFAERVYAIRGHRTLKDLPADNLSREPVVKRSPNLSEIHRGQMPDVIGMGASDALMMLESAGFHQVEIRGVGTVRNQTNLAGNIILTLKQ